MPIKWTPENNEILLCKVLETSRVIADVKAISASWPTNKGEVPTPRAITERLCKIRSIAKANGGSHFSVKAAKSNYDAENTTTPTPLTPSSAPRKPRAKKANSQSAPGSGKRKRNDEVAVQEGFMDENINPGGLYEDEDEIESPSKKIQVQVPKYVAWEVLSGEESEEAAKTDESPDLEEERV